MSFQALEWKIVFLQLVEMHIHAEVMSHGCAGQHSRKSQHSPIVSIEVFEIFSRYDVNDMFSFR